MVLLNLFVVTSLGAVDSRSVESSPIKPNVVLILADDLGYTDLGVMGSDLYQTPNIDGLASQGLRFTNAHSSHPTCSPSRTAIMTGKYPARLGIVGHGGRGTVTAGDGTFMPCEEYTMAEALTDAGYTTCHIGKWHVGHEGTTGPKEQGFQFDIASNEFCCPGSYIYPYRNKKKAGVQAENSAVPDLQDRGPDDHLTECLGDEAVKFISSHKDEPFFLNLAYYAVHTPIESERDKVAKYKKLITPDSRQRNAAYAGLVEHLDESVGRVLKAIRDNGLERNTIVIFFSDNGGEVTHGETSNYPLRDGKVSQYLGGIRVPLIVKWPGVTPVGATSEIPVIGHDLYPSILQMVGAQGDTKHNAQIDGVDLTAVFQDPASQLDRQALHWLRYPVVFHYRKGERKRGPVGTIIKGNWKLMEFFPTPHGQDRSFELYNLREDISEQENVAAANPELVTELHQEMIRWRESVDAPEYEMAFKEYEKIP
ncbi:Arylsulfatase [Planctomycetes bacterium CA13]|uniref:Arylsulfatase n=1 Tax=Novipirellula herctigrandis TaxID=2527986 RepID=A0A5C5ZAK4_9BACT|nr:Arylsulfatase [Planctomycetes bacterium CA13]